MGFRVEYARIISIRRPGDTFLLGLGFSVCRAFLKTIIGPYRRSSYLGFYMEILVQGFESWGVDGSVDLGFRVYVASLRGGAFRVKSAG